MFRKKILLLLLPLLLGLAGCGTARHAAAPPNSGTVIIASKPMTEEYILAHMVADMLRARTHLRVDTSKIGLGPTEMLQPAILSGEIDMYPEYTGTAWMAVLKKPVIHDRRKLTELVKQDYRQKFGLDWLGNFGFQDTFACVVRPSTARRLHLRTIADAAKVKGLVFAADAPAFTRPDEYPGLRRVYGADWTPKVMDVNFLTTAVESHQADIALVDSTSPRIAEYHLVVLQDNRNFFPPYDCGLVVRGALLRQHPEIRRALKPLFGAISAATMRELNYRVEIRKESPSEVARSFLLEKGLL